MPDYKNGKIYTIRYKNDDTLIYVGSTTQPLYKRWFEHKCRCSKENNEHYNKNIYVKIRETEINNWYIELYEDIPCERKEQLEKREGEIIRDIGNLNKIIPGSKEQKNEEYGKTYYQQKKEYFQQYGMEYYKQNKEKKTDLKIEIIKDYVSENGYKNATDFATEKGMKYYQICYYC